MSTYYVDAAVGNDGNAGTSEGAGNAWLTIDNAMNNVVAGDHVYVKGGVDYTEMATLDTLGTTSDPIIFEGYTTTPGDNGQAIIDATGENNGIYNSVSANMYYIFRNITIKNSTYDGWNLSSRYRMIFENCKADNCGTRGFDVGGYATFIECESSNNSLDGYFTTGDSKYISCLSSNNGGDGFKMNGSSSTALFCISTSDAEDGFEFSDGCLVVNCTVDGDNLDSTTGINIANGGEFGSIVINTIIYNCATGISGDPSDSEEFTIGRNNLINANTTAYANWSTRSQSTDITSAPGFTDEAGGDYTLAASSAARNAGYDNSGISSPGMDIGAHQSADSGGGSSKIVITG